MKTILCVPGHDAKKVAKCREYGADLIQFDLEDSVPVWAKQQAREMVAAVVTMADSVRINGEPGNKEKDLAAIDGSAGSIGIPKARDWREWMAFGRWILPIIETPSALLLALAEFRALREAKLPMFGLAFGADDYAASSMTRRNSAQVEAGRASVGLLATALGIPGCDSPCVQLDEVSVRTETRRAWELGYTWKIVIHPRQIEWVKSEGARLDAEEMAHGRDVLRRYDEQEEAVVMLGGELAAPPLVSRLRAITARAAQ